MKKAATIFESSTHKWIVLSRDPGKPNHLIDTNEYVIVSRDALMLTDPGGPEIFPAVFTALSSVCDPRRIEAIFSSHQDPDIISSLSLWLECNPEIKCYLSWLWSGFVPHFGGTEKTFVSIPDQGMTISLGDLELVAVPAHYLHSSGNFHLYDARARLLFSGDIGAALLPQSAGLFVENFDAHIKAAEGFHRRWMGSNEAKLDWCARVSKLDIELLCPQHGAIYRGKDVERFINWFAELKVGITQSA